MRSAASRRWISPSTAPSNCLQRDCRTGRLGVGRMRRDYGIRSFAYDAQTVASGTWRYGVSDRFTAELHAEGGGGVVNAGAGGWWLLGGAGVINAAYVHSRHGRPARAASTRWGTAGTTAASTSTCSPGAPTATTATWARCRTACRRTSANRPPFGVNLDRAGSLSASYLRLRYPRRRGQPLRQRVLVAQLRRSAGRPTCRSTRTWIDRGDRSIYLSLSTALGATARPALSTQRNGDDAPTYVADVSQPVPGDGSQGGVGWRVQARGGDDGGGGLAEAGLARTGSAATRWATARAGRYRLRLCQRQRQPGVDGRAPVRRARGAPMRSRVVSTDGHPGIPVRLENRLIGSTDRNGLLLVTPLLSWQRNRLSIDTLDLPADMRADRVDAWVTPRQSAGLGVDFGLRRTLRLERGAARCRRPAAAGGQHRAAARRAYRHGGLRRRDLPGRRGVAGRPAGATAGRPLQRAGWPRPWPPPRPAPRGSARCAACRSRRRCHERRAADRPAAGTVPGLP